MARLTAIEDAIEAGRTPLAVVTLSGPAGLWRVAGDATEIADATAPDGVLRIEAGLTSLLPFSETFDGYNLESLASLTQVQVSVLLEPWPMTNQGTIQAFLGSRVEVAIVWPGQDWADRRVLLTGRLQAVRFGNEGEPVSFSAENTPPITSGIVGDDTRDLGEDYPSPHDALGNDLSGLEGRKPPVVLGTAKRIPGYKIGADAGLNRLFLCEHELPIGDITYYEDGVQAAADSPQSGTGPGGAFRYLTSAVHFAAPTGGYTWDAENGGLEGSRNAADVLRLLLRFSGLRVDNARMQRAYSLLRGWEIGLVIDSQAPAIEIIRQRLLPWLPLVEVNGADGLWFAYVDPLDTSQQRALVVGSGIVWRMGEVVVSDMDQIRNSFTLAYNYDSYTQTYTQTMGLGWQTRDSTSTRISYDAMCRASYQLYGDLADDLLECPIVWDRATAGRILRARAQRLSIPRLQITYLYEPALCYDIEMGDVVTLTDPDLGLNGDRAIVREIERTLRAPMLVLETVPSAPGRF